MKITKQRLRRIIKEELSISLTQNVEDAFYDFERNLDAALNQADPRWMDNPAVKELIFQKLDKLKWNLGG